MTPDDVYRLRRYFRKQERAEKYEGTYEIVDDGTEQVLASCDLIGKAVFSVLEVMDHRQEVWEMRPNRKIMPSRWTVTDPGGTVAMQFDQKVFGKMVNPLYKTVLVLQDGEGREACRLVDPRTSIPDRLLGLGPDEWAFLRGDELVAKLVRLPARKKPGKGLFGKLKNLLTSSDQGIVSAGSSHAFPAPVALAVLLLFRELTDISGG